MSAAERKQEKTAESALLQQEAPLFRAMLHAINIYFLLRIFLSIFYHFSQVFKSRVIQSGFPGLCMVDDVRTELNCNERDDDHSYNLHFVPLSKFQLCRRDSLRDLQGLRCACGRLLPLRNAKHLQGRHLRTVCAE